jgi:flagellar basal-body rod protein FlgB
MDAVDKILSKALDVSWAREEALANNVANADTPGYVRKDIDFQAEMQKVILAQGDIDSGEVTKTTDIPGQAIALEKEVAQISNNTILYTSVAKIAGLRQKILSDSADGGTSSW